jgi:nucleotide-binding universal stress UspA family protein
MKNILVPIDHSDCSAAAAEVAIRLAHKAQAKIYFLHLYIDYDGYQHVPLSIGKLQVDRHHQNPSVGMIKDELAKLVAKADAISIKASPLLSYHDGHERIEDYIKPYNIDFVVMGSHGVRGIKETILGSNTQRFIRRSPVPVLVVKEQPDDFNIHKIVFVSSFEEDSIKSFEPVNSLAKFWNAEIYLLYVNTPYHFKETHESMFEMKRFMHQFPHATYTPFIYNALDEERGLEEFTTQKHVDVIALGTHGNKGIFRLLSHGVAEAIINHQRKPVLITNTNVMEEEGIMLRQQEFDLRQRINWG